MTIKDIIDRKPVCSICNNNHYNCDCAEIIKITNAEWKEMNARLLRLEMIETKKYYCRWCEKHITPRQFELSHLTHPIQKVIK